MILEKLTTSETLINFELTLNRYRAFGLDLANRFDGQQFRKVVWLDEKCVLFELFKNDGAIWLKVDMSLTETEKTRIVEISRHLLGLNFDLASFYQRSKHDSVLDEVVRKFYGYRPTLCDDLFEMIVTSISAQQINLAFAFKVRSRLVEKYGESLMHDGERYFAFPRPGDIARASIDELYALKFT